MGLRTVAVYSMPTARRCTSPAATPPCASARPRPRAATSTRRPSSPRRGHRRGGVHPGYGFLSENAGLAEACEAAGIAFVGPPPRRSGHGLEDRGQALMEKAGVPLVPGYHGDDQASAVLARAAARIGFPVLIKASAGGGGKGMRVVEPRRRIRRRARHRRGARPRPRSATTACCSNVPGRAAPHRGAGLRRQARQLACTCSSATARSSAGTRR
jgi:3-methylcrotonyl-CoA carboxylase alpha subunit